MRGTRVWVMALLAALGLSACGSSDGQSAGKYASAPATYEAEAPEAASGEAAGGEADTASQDAASEEAAPSGEGSEVAAAFGGGRLPGVGPSVIKTAEVRVEVRRNTFHDRLQEATAVAGTHGGYLLSSTVVGRRARSGSLVLRIPGPRFELALSELHGLGKVLRERVSGQEVGQEFVDIQARLRNLRGQEGVLLSLYDRAATIGDSIRVQNEVSAVQLRIEELEGGLRYLKDQAAFGTISLSMVEEGLPPPVSQPPGAVSRAWDRAVELTVSIVSSFVYGLGYLVPLGLLALLLLPLARRLWVAAGLKRS